MKPVKQTIRDRKYGNCLQACVASYLEKELMMVPNFMLFEKEYWEATQLWFDSIGYNISYSFENPPNDNNYYITSIENDNKKGKWKYHAVITKNNVIIHDPSPSKTKDKFTIKGHYIITELKL